MLSSRNRIIIKVELIGKSVVKLTLLYLDERFLSSDRSFNYFHRKSMNNFYFSSRGTFEISDSFVRFPDLKNYQRGVTVEKNFRDEQRRYDFLKNFYNGLNLWNDNFDGFKKSIDYQTRNSKVLLQGIYWII